MDYGALKNYLFLQLLSFWSGGRRLYRYNEDDFFIYVLIVNKHRE